MKTDIRIKRTYRRLFDSLMTLLAQKSFDGITIIEICNEADIHRATFYKHFTDKYDFLSKCLTEKIRQLTADSSENTKADVSFHDSSMRMLLNIIQFVQENRSILISIGNNGFTSSFEAALVDSVFKFVVESINNSERVIVAPSKNVELIASFYAGGIVGSLKYWLHTEDAKTGDTDKLTALASRLVTDLEKELTN